MFSAMNWIYAHCDIIFVRLFLNSFKHFHLSVILPLDVPPLGRPTELSRERGSQIALYSAPINTTIYSVIYTCTVSDLFTRLDPGRDV